MKSGLERLDKITTIRYLEFILSKHTFLFSKSPSMACFNCILIFFFVIISTVTSRSVPQESTLELTLLANRTTEQQQQQVLITLANYRHRLEHSPNFKEFRWALSQRFASPYCDVCDLFLPAVNIILYTCTIKDP